MTRQMKQRELIQSQEAQIMQAKKEECDETEARQG